MPRPPTLSEFDLIRRFFSHMTTEREDVILGVGDDAALLAVPPGQSLAVSVDTLVSGVHFLPSVEPQALGHKSLAVNLSDLAAMGAEPAWATLALTLPEVDESWLQAFAQGFSALAAKYGIQLVGGDTTRGPLSMTVTVHGLVPAASALRRAGARAGDRIYVTGCLGDAALYLKLLKTGEVVDGGESLRDRLERPWPRVEAGLALRGLASSAIDISDGLLADLGHILEASGVGASLVLDRIPRSGAVAGWLSVGGDWSTVVAGGDDYELCFTADPAKVGEIDRISRSLGLPMTPVGTIEATSGLRVVGPDGSAWQPPRCGFDHFPPSGESS